MKEYISTIYILSVAWACLFSIGCTTGPGPATAPPANSGHVLIYRVANFGENLGLVVSVDGKDVGTFSQSENYSGYLTAGQHVLMARPDPNPAGTSPARKTVTIQTGQTYVYTAAWAGGGTRLTLVRGH
jgi:hypothetical protein